MLMHLVVASLLLGVVAGESLSLPRNRTKYHTASQHHVHIVSAMNASISYCNIWRLRNFEKVDKQPAAQALYSPVVLPRRAAELNIC